MMRRTSLLLLILSVTLLIGCRGVGARKRGRARDVFASWQASLGRDRLSSRTQQTLRSWDLARAHAEKPAKAMAQLQRLAEKEEDPDVIFALAETCYHQARSNQQCCSCSLDYYYLCAGYAYHYIFAPGTTLNGRDRSSPFDPRFRAACDLYNVAVAQCIKASQKVGRLDARKALTVPVCERCGFRVPVTHTGFTWKPEEFGEMLLCSDYEVTGLQNQHHSYGLGVPLIVRRNKKAPLPHAEKYPPNVSFPATAFLRFPGTLADLRSNRTGKLELINPLATDSTKDHGIPVSLETDLTTPLAYFLQENDLSKVGIRGFLRPAQIDAHAGLYMMEPYQPDKIPVVLVHGLLSSPVTWAPMFNDLRSDPEIRKRYQFWFYLYPTAHPYLASAAQLRKSLADAREKLDPRHTHAGMDEMVMVSHSMGGLVSRLLTVDSNDDFWKLVSDEPFEKFAAGDKARESLRDYFFFKRLPFVKRVVFLGTPHRGSRLSPALPGRLARRFIELPRKAMEATRLLAEAGKDMFNLIDPDRGALSLDLLAPGSPALDLLASRPRSKDTQYHSIIGVAECSTSVYLTRLIAGEDPNERGDGVVTYASAHLKDVESEAIVQAEHTVVHQHALAIREVRRILLKHAQSVGKESTYQILPVSSQK